MTNDLNTIPASVRDEIIRVINMLIADHDYAPAEHIKNNTLPLIEKLCQPNIVIVDLDDAGTVERITRDYFHFYKRYKGGMDYYPNNQEASHACMKAALAALKENP